MAFRKDDEDKLKWSKFAWRGATRILQIFHWGAEHKYDWDNWRQPDADITRLIDAAIRHLIARVNGEVNDPESGYDHIAHAGWNIIVALEHIALGTGVNYPKVKERHIAVDPQILPHADSTFSQLNDTTQSNCDGTCYETGHHIRYSQKENPDAWREDILTPGCDVLEGSCACGAWHIKSGLKLGDEDFYDYYNRG